jgi:hypothetical protein
VNDIKKQVIDAEADEDVTVLANRRAVVDDDETIVSDKSRPVLSDITTDKRTSPIEVNFGSSAEVNRKALSVNFILPAILLTVALLGGLRLSSADSSFVFLGPPLLCLILAVMVLALFTRAGILRLNSWFSNSYSLFQNGRNGWLLFTLFAASAQLFNSLIPEQGLPFWVVGFCFFWTLWNNLFADFDPRRLLKSLGALFGLAFVVKYLVLANLTAPEGGSWLTRIMENPGKEAFTWILDLPRFSSGTGYIQFVAAALYFLGLLMLPPHPEDEIVIARG